MKWAKYLILLAVSAAVCISVLMYLNSTVIKSVQSIRIIGSLQAPAGESNIAPGQEEGKPSWIEGVRLVPGVPLVTSDIDAVVKRHGDAPEGLEFSYEWFINTRPVEAINLSRLPQGLFKKYDRIIVRVTPFHNGKRGAMFVSQTAIVRNSPLELILSDKVLYQGDAIVLQLIGRDPDGGKITYSLESPVIEGMTIDKETGKITWMAVKSDAGVFKFGASVSGAEGAKETKIFEFSTELK